MLLAILVVLSMTTVLLAVRVARRQNEALAVKKLLLHHVEMQHKKLDRDYRKFKTSLNQMKDF